MILYYVVYCAALRALEAHHILATLAALLRGRDVCETDVAYVLYDDTYIQMISWVCERAARDHTHQAHEHI